MDELPPATGAQILLVDDEFSVRDALGQWLRKDGHTVTAVADAAQALQALQAGRFDVALVDIKMPGMDGLELQQHIHRLDPHTAVILITAFASVDTAVRALKQGAFDYVTKPIAPDELSHLVWRALQERRLREENFRLRQAIEKLSAEEAIIGQSPAMRKVMELVDQVAQTDTTVLLRGESGTGKELVARAIHARSRRRWFPLVAVNCGALPESLLESELFGYEKGAFTGAAARHKGKLELADGGTLFLDEVGAIPPKMQLDLLRVLDTREFTRLGGSRPVQADFRVIAATNEDLDRAVAQGRFREDFYYRIHVMAIDLPPLRQRPSDIPALAQHFLARLAAQTNKRFTEITPEAMQLLVSHSWPGNVRELANAIERAVVVGRPPAIRPEDLPLPGPCAATFGPADSLAEVEKRHIAAVLQRTGGNITRAAEILQVDRVTVYKKIKKYGLRLPGRPEPENA